MQHVWACWQVQDLTPLTSADPLIYEPMNDLWYTQLFAIYLLVSQLKGPAGWWLSVCGASNLAVKAHVMSWMSWILNNCTNNSLQRYGRSVACSTDSRYLAARVLHSSLLDPQHVYMSAVSIPLLLLMWLPRTLLKALPPFVCLFVCICNRNEIFGCESVCRNMSLSLSRALVWYMKYDPGSAVGVQMIVFKGLTHGKALHNGL